MNLKELFKNLDKKWLNIIYIIFLAGLCLITIDLPKKEEAEIATPLDTATESLEEKMENTFSQIQGVGKVKVLINYKSSQENVLAKDISYSKNDSDNNNSTSTDEKIVFSNNSEPIILKEKYPEIQGVLIVAQGGDNIEIKNQLIRCSQALLGIEVNKIEVLKMKS